MSHTALDSLVRAGYTDREATFLYMAAVHSGYFLRRQFIASVKRERGGVATSFLRKATELGHIAALPCAEGRYIYHLHSKQVYRLVGRDDSQSRRLKSLPEIRRRLIALDYVLNHLGQESFVESDEARQQLFISLRVEPKALQRTAAFLPSVPTSFQQSEEPPTVRFAFVDEAQRSTSRFAHFLEAYAGLIRSLERAVVAYASTSPMNFTAARRLFERFMPLGHGTSACPLGIDHLVRWLETRHRFHSGRGAITPADHQLLIQGESIYRAPVHLGLIASWSNGAMDAGKVRRLFHAETHRARFVTELIDADYPKFLNLGVGSSMGSIRGQGFPRKTLFDNSLAEGGGGG